MSPGFTSQHLRWGAFAAAAALCASACVPASQYNATRSALETEEASNRQMMNELYQARHKLSAVESDARSRDDKAAQQDEALAQAQLDDSIQAKKRQNAAQLVDQLREELSRVGDHLRFFVGQNGELKKQLAAAQAQDQHLAADVLVVRDLALLLNRELAKGEVELGVAGGVPVLRVASSRVFGASGRALTPTAAKIFSALVRMSELHKNSRMRVSEVGLSASVTQAERAQRLRLVARALTGAGIAPGRVELALPTPPSSAPRATGTRAAHAPVPNVAPEPPAHTAPELDIAIDTAPS